MENVRRVGMLCIALITLIIVASIIFIVNINLKEESIAVIGDQIFTDIIGANRCNMFSILVEPISKKDLLITKWKRPIENWIIKKYLKNKEAN